jgi:RHS repeat-associated protein
VRIVSPTGTVIYSYDGDNVNDVLDATGAWQSRITHGLGVDEPLEIRQQSVPLYYHADGLGSIAAVTNASRAVAASYVYDSFGNTTMQTQIVVSPYGFTGREAASGDGAANPAGLYYYRARYYDPLWGRFLSEDPIHFGGGDNFYRYVGNSPASYTDPSGLYSLHGFPPAEAAQMTIAIGELAAKLRAQPCCTGDPRLGQRLLDLLQPFSYGTGANFVYKKTLPGACAEVRTFGEFLTNTIEVSEDALGRPECPCPLAGIILHELVHLTWDDYTSPDPERAAYQTAYRCFGDNCARPAAPRHQ